MQISKIGIAAIVCLTTLSVTGCKDENASMYVVTDTGTTVETETSTAEAKDNYSYIEAQVSEGADSDKKLGKKHIIEINGQPIAELVDTYQNDYGFVTAGSGTYETTETTETELSQPEGTDINQTDESDTNVVSVEADGNVDMSDIEEWLADSDYDSISDAFSDFCEKVGLKYGGSMEYSNDDRDDGKVDHVLMPSATYKIDSDTFFMIQLWIPQSDATLDINDKLAELEDEMPFYDLNVSSSGKFIYGTVVNGNSGTNTNLGNALLKTVLALSMTDKQIYDK